MELDVKKLIYSETGSKEAHEVNITEKGDDDLEGPVFYSGSLELLKIDEGILAKFNVQPKIILICDRCQEEFTYNPMLVFVRDYILGSVDPESDSLGISKNFTIDILDPIKEESQLSIPLKKLCKEVCAGICPYCGKNLNLGDCECGKARNKKL